MHIVMTFEDLIGWILLLITVVVFGTWFLAIVIRNKYRAWKKKRREKKEAKKDADKQ